MEAQVIAVAPIDTWPAIVAIKTNAYLLASLKAVHLLGVAVLVGAVVAFDLRVLGFNRGGAIAALGRQLLPLALAALVVVLPSGVMLFALDASALLTSDALMLKLALIVAGAGIAIAFHAGPYRAVERWDQGEPTPLLAKLLAASSLLCWSAVLYCAAAIGTG